MKGKGHIQTGCPEPITLLGVILCRNKSEILKREKDIQRKFKAYKTVGEWFKNASEILSYLEDFIVSGQDILEEDYQRHRERDRERNRERYQNDPEYRESKNKRKRERYQNDPEYRERAT